MEDTTLGEPIPPSNGSSHGANGEDNAANVDGPVAAAHDEADSRMADATSDPPLSKKQQKKLKRRQIWEERKQDRKLLRKEKKQEQRAKRRAERDQKIAEAKAAGLDPEEVLKAEVKPTKRPASQTPVPITLILDCDFEKYMRETELVSLSSQITRSYSENRTAQYRAHLFISSWGGKMKERYETVLRNYHKNWLHTNFMEEDFIAAAAAADEIMKGPHGGTLEGALATSTASGQTDASKPEPSGSQADAAPTPEAEEGVRHPSVVYLTSESPYTLERLEPYTSYVIGGIVDKNREKGLCYKRAKERGVRTAKLPIGEYMIMAARQVLTTNQVVEIMLKWLETGDWGEAFTKSIPKRKGGRLKSAASEAEARQDGEGGSGAAEEEEDEEEQEAA